LISRKVVSQGYFSRLNLSWVLFTLGALALRRRCVGVDVVVGI
jgi:hypothetical protein